jgi:hypothetical protein
MSLFSNKSYLSNDEEKRLEEAFNILGENGLKQSLPDNKNAGNFFGYNGDPTTRFCGLNVRYRMNDSERTRKNILIKLEEKYKFKHQFYNNHENEVYKNYFLNCAKLIQDYREKRGIFNITELKFAPEMSKDRALVLEKLCDIIFHFCDKDLKNEDNIKNLIKLTKNIKALSESKKVWCEGRNFGGTSINDLLLKIATAFSFPILETIVDLKVIPTATIIDDFRKGIRSFLDSIAGAMDDSFGRSLNDKKISINCGLLIADLIDLFVSENSNINFHEVKLYEIDKENYYSITNEQDIPIGKNDHQVFWKLEFTEKGKPKARCIYFKFVIKKIDPKLLRSKSVDIISYEKERLNYRKYMVMNYAICQIWYLKYAIDLINQGEEYFQEISSNKKSQNNVISFQNKFNPKSGETVINLKRYFKNEVAGKNINKNDKVLLAETIIDDIKNDNDDKNKLNKNDFLRKNGNNLKIEGFKKWPKCLNEFSNTIGMMNNKNIIELEEKYTRHVEMNMNSLNKHSIKNLINLVDRLVKSLKEQNAKTLVRIAFDRIPDHAENKKFYLSFVVEGGSIYGIWNRFVNNFPFLDHETKKILLTIK